MVAGHLEIDRQMIEVCLFSGMIHVNPLPLAEYTLASLIDPIIGCTVLS